MNKVILVGRLTRDPDVRYTQGENSMCVARYTLAVDRRRGRNGEEPQADFISCVAFGRSGEFAEKYFHKGIKIALTGRIQTGSYTNRSGVKVYTTDVIVDDQEFAESKASSGSSQNQARNAGSSGSSTSRDNSGRPAAGRQDQRSNPVDDFVNSGFDNLGDGFDEELPFT